MAHVHPHGFCSPHASIALRIGVSALLSLVMARDQRLLEWPTTTAFVALPGDVTHTQCADPRHTVGRGEAHSRT
eukprot:3523312-Rhodomonas_salina.5